MYSARASGLLVPEHYDRAIVTTRSLPNTPTRIPWPEDAPPSIDHLHNPALYNAIAYRAEDHSLVAGVRANTNSVKPTGTVDDDIVLNFLLILAGASVSVPSGFTALTGSPISYAGGVLEFHGAWHRAATDGANYAWTHSSTTSSCVTATYSGCVATGSPLDVANSSNSGSGTTVTGTGITTASLGAMLVFAFALGTLPASAATQASGMTERLDPSNTSGNGGVGFDDAIQAAAGASGDKTVTITSDFWAAFLIALKPLMAPPRLAHTMHAVQRAATW